MQKIKNIQIGHRSFTLKELPVRAIWDIMDQKPGQGGGMEQYMHLLRLACPELTSETLVELYPSEIEELWQGFQEVNAAFLGVVNRIGLFDLLIDTLKPVLEKEMRQAMARLELPSTDPSASSSPPATAPLSGTTDSVSS